MHSPSRLEASLRGKSQRINYEAKSLPPTVLGKLHEPLNTTVSPLYIYCVHVGATLQLPIPNVRTAISRTVGAHTPTIIPSNTHNCRHSISPCQSIQCYENLTLHIQPAAIALNYSVKNIQNNVQQI